MTRLKLHGGLYPLDAVRRAVAVLSPFGTIAVSASAKPGGYHVVEVSANDDVDEAELAGELGNHALVNAVSSGALTH